MVSMEAPMELADGTRIRRTFDPSIMSYTYFRGLPSVKGGGS